MIEMMSRWGVGVSDPVRQESWWRRMLERAEKFHLLLSTLYYFIGIVAAVVAVLTVSVNFLNRSDKSNIKNIIEPPFGELLPDWFYIWLLENRYLATSLCGAVFVAAWALRSREFSRKLRSMQFLDEIVLDHSIMIQEIASFPRNGDIERLADHLRAFLRYDLNRISVLFSAYTGSHCHVSLKILDPDHGEIRTIARDHHFRDPRPRVDDLLPRFQFSRNTAFNEILTNPGVSYYLCNHLRLRKILKGYDNANPMWSDYYRACLVVPITTATDPASIRPNKVWGFIAVDNKRGGFDDYCAWAILQTIARLYNLILAELAMVPTRYLEGSGR